MSFKMESFGTDGTYFAIRSHLTPPLSVNSSTHSAVIVRKQSATCRFFLSAHTCCSMKGISSHIHISRWGTGKQDHISPHGYWVKRAFETTHSSNEMVSTKVFPRRLARSGKNWRIDCISIFAKVGTIPTLGNLLLGAYFFWQTSNVWIVCDERAI
jgi:hypothetical protein